ncbi:type II toxin-antitoxin system prevent-host-death family antitoxin [Candidatus Nucleicultrix amoebiphila]|jgi:prevent-host-death family protein|uniref:Antitoxin n=1 Tax=Candidatus Nucleicultrix amoebiphila FS5 TaxID=1414854 RepID=A0A1W6N3R0_9PROT|nr:type II toxin-antitoxin system prevent-host-death family antitoxin [Candidatus Nucleicultrix amoebiphila]ARN84416.1 prevent-host-death protein [Candidatus Nucleicultrix amoebiphila FS5]
MFSFSSADCQRKWGEVQDKAIAAPVTISNKGRDRLVLMSVEEYHRLKKRDRQVMSLQDFTTEDIAVLKVAEAPAEAEAFNHEVSK